MWPVVDIAGVSFLAGFFGAIGWVLARNGLRAIGVHDHQTIITNVFHGFRNAEEDQ